MPSKLSQIEFEKRVHDAHGDRYDLSEAVYINRRTKVRVLCKEHGGFDIWPISLMRGFGCRKCGNIHQAELLSKPHLSFEEEVIRMKKIQHNRFDYVSPDEYHGINQKIEVVCKKCGHHFMQTVSDQLQGCGCPKCRAINSSLRSKGKANKKLRRMVCGIGIYDTDNVDCHNLSYRIWREMICRCYGKSQLKRPSYIGCKVCEEWLTYSNYKEWYDEHYIEGFEIDKDLLSGKLYSPQTCVFLPSEINSFLVVKKHENKKSKLPIGVFEGEGAYIANCGNVYLGSFKDLEMARNAYIKEKKRQLNILTEKWKDKIESRAYEALKNLDIIKHYNL